MEPVSLRSTSEFQSAPSFGNAARGKPTTVSAPERPVVGLVAMRVGNENDRLAGHESSGLENSLVEFDGKEGGVKDRGRGFRQITSAETAPRRPLLPLAGDGLGMRARQ